MTRYAWQEEGEELMTPAQRRLFNAACQDLEHLVWHGFTMSKDDYRHLICATVLGERLVPGINTGHGPPGIVRMARSSKELTKTEATQAIRTAFDLGDYPEDQGLPPGFRWGATVCKCRYVLAEDPDAFR